MNLNYSRM